MVIQSIRLHPSGPDQADAASNVSRENPTSAVRLDWKHPPRNRKVAVHDRGLTGRFATKVMVRPVPPRRPPVGPGLKPSPAAGRLAG
jgi:hypothetical protein